MASNFLHKSTLYGFLIHTLNLRYCDLKPNSKIFTGSYGVDSRKKQRPNISCYCPFKILFVPLKSSQKQKTPGGKKDLISSYSTAKNMPKIAKVTLKLRTSEKIAIAELQSCGCGATFLNKLRNCVCGSSSFKLRNCDCGL